MRSFFSLFAIIEKALSTLPPQKKDNVRRLAAATGRYLVKHATPTAAKFNSAGSRLARTATR
jgi:hypothetical protein